MNDPELDDSAEQLQNRDTSHAFPLGMKLLFAGLVLWGVYYLFAYSPWSSGWTQERDLEGAASTTFNVFSTVAYTVIPTAVIVVLAVVMARRRKASR